MVTANTASRNSPTSARSATKRRRLKFMLAPQATATRVFFWICFFSTYFFIPAMARAPAGSRMLRVSVKTSLIAAQISSVSTVIISSTTFLQIRKVSLPTNLTAVPSENRPTSFISILLPALSDRFIASESEACTPITFVFGLTALMYSPIPAIKPPPPIATNTASMGFSYWVKISWAMVPCPAITSGSSNGWTKVRPLFLPKSSACKKASL